MPRHAEGYLKSGRNILLRKSFKASGFPDVTLGDLQPVAGVSDTCVYKEEFAGCPAFSTVFHRLDRYRAGQRMQYADVSLESLAAAAIDTFGADTSHYRPFNPGAAGRAAALIAELL